MSKDLYTETFLKHETPVSILQFVSEQLSKSQKTTVPVPLFSVTGNHESEVEVSWSFVLASINSDQKESVVPIALERISL